MSKQISYQSSQLQLSLWSETVTTSETTKSEVVKEIVRYTCSVEEFKAQQELENDLISGRGAWLYKQLEKEIAWERAQEKALDTIMAMRAEVNNKHYKF